MQKQNQQRDAMRMQQFKVARMKKEIQQLLQQFQQLEKDAAHNPKAAQRLAKMQAVFQENFDQAAFLKECEALKAHLNNGHKPVSKTTTHRQKTKKAARISNFA